MWLLDLLAKGVVSFLGRVFKDWRRDQSLEDKGRADQRNEDFEEGEKRRKRADEIDHAVEADDVSVGSGEL